ncbi:MAG: VCBS repeat-containing protein, partial [Chloroflexota bacterium]
MLIVAHIPRSLIKVIALTMLLGVLVSTSYAAFEPDVILIGAESLPTTSLAWADWDGDGDLDLAVGNRNQPNQVYENDGGVLKLDVDANDPGQRFGWKANEASATTSLAWGDMDWDGDLDLAVGNWGQPNQVYRNDDGALNLVWQSTETNWTTSVAWSDWQGAQGQTVAFGNWRQPIQVYQSRGDHFDLIWQSDLQEQTTSLAWGDWDGDGQADLAIGNRNQPNRVYQSAVATLQSVWQSDQAEATTSIAWGDWDGDDDLDLAVGNAQQRNRVYQNEAGTLEPAWQSEARHNTTSLAWADWNNDGYRDLAVGNQGQPNEIYENDGFSLELAWQSEDINRTRSVAWGDLNQDGGIDLAVGNHLQPNLLYKNLVEPEIVIFGVAAARNTRPILFEEQWATEVLCPPDRCGKNRFRFSHNFIAPRGAVEVGIKATWVWDGAFVGQEQNEEHFRVNAAAAEGICLDMGNGPVSDGLCWETRFPYDQDLEVTVTHLVKRGESVSPESIKAIIDVVWYGEPQPPNCNDVALSVPNGSIIHPLGTTTDVTIDGENAAQFRIVRTDTRGVAPEAVVPDQPTNQFDAVPVMPNVPYQGQVGNAQGEWSNQDCEFQFSTQRLVPEGTATCNEAILTNPNLYPIDVVFNIDGQAQFSGTIPANGTHIVDYNYTDGASHQAEFSWTGAGESGLVDLGSFGPCGAVVPTATATCAGGAVTNPNIFPLQIIYRVDGIQVFAGDLSANTTLPVPYVFNDGASHSAEVAWSGNGESGILNLGSFGPCGALPPSGTAQCDGGSISNPNSFAIQVEYRLDSVVQFNGAIPANATESINFTLDDGQSHTAEFDWSGNGQNGTITLGAFGPCGAAEPMGMVDCSGGDIQNPNSFAIQVTFTVDGVIQFTGQVAANTTQTIPLNLNTGAFHAASFTWSGNGQNGTTDLGMFGPCGAVSPLGTATCDGGTVTNPNSFTIQVTFTVDGVIQFTGQIAANSTETIAYTFNDGASHQAEFSWSGNGQNDTVVLGIFGPCSALTPNGTVTCTGGTVTNPNAFPIQVIYTLDGQTNFSVTVPANDTLSIPFVINDGAIHQASFTWSGNNENGVVNLGSFGPCGAAMPTGTAGCDGGTVINPNPFPIQVEYIVDGTLTFQSQVAANSTQ